MNPWIGFGGGGDDDDAGSSSDSDHDYDDIPGHEQGNDGQDSADTSNQDTGDRD